MKGILPGCLILCWAGLAVAAGNDVIVISCDDAGLASALVSATSQQYSGPVAVAPARWSGVPQPGYARLQVAQVDDHKWRLTLSGPDANVSREITLAGTPRQLDVAEAIALAVPPLVTRLEARQKAARARESLKEETAAPPVCPAVPVPVPVPVAPPTAPPSPAPAPAGSGPPAAAGAPVAGVIATTEDHPLPVIPRWRRWTLGLMPALYFSGETTIPGGGAEVIGSFAFSRGWLAEASIGGYATHAWTYNIGVVPLDAFVAARGRWDWFSAEIGLGPELNIGAASPGAAPTFAVATELTVGVQLSESWMIGVRAVAAFIPGNPDIAVPQPNHGSGGGGMSGDDDNNSIFLSQGQARVGVFVGWTP